MKKSMTILLFFLASIIYSQAQTWSLVWSDEFTDPAIQSANWVFETGGGGWGNSELENYTSRPENATINNGNLLIIARKESYQGSAYTSARMKTQDLHSWTYGKVESRIKIPSGQGIWPAFWMLGEDISTVSWPACGEIDIMEHINNSPTMNGTIHWDNNGATQYGGTASFDASQYHIYSIEWDNNAITWFLDGTQYVQANIANNVNSTEEFHKPFFVLLNLSVGGQWPGNPDATTVFPDTMYVDYVRVYQDNVTAVEGEAAAGTSLSVHPNPSAGISFINYSLQSDALVNLYLYDVYGKKIMSLISEHQSSGDHQFSLNTSQLPAGIYFLKASFNEEEVIYKVVKN